MTLASPFAFIGPRVKQSASGLTNRAWLEGVTFQPHIDFKLLRGTGKARTARNEMHRPDIKGPTGEKKMTKVLQLQDASVFDVEIAAQYR